MKRRFFSLITVLVVIISNKCLAQQKDTVIRSWFSFVQKIDAQKYQGKKFIFQGYIKVVPITHSAWAGLWFRVDKMDNSMGFFNNMYDRRVQNPSWKAYSIEGVIDSAAKEINFGGICMYNGSFSFDDFSLKIENNGSWENIAINNGGFEETKNTGWKTGVGRKEIVVTGFDNQILQDNAAQGKSCYVIKSTTVDTYGENDEIGKYFETNKAKIYYEEYGKGEPLLLLHGNGQSISAMSNQIRFFKDKYRVIIPDCRGRGKSIDSDDELTYDIQASDMNNLLSHLHIDSANIIGWSDGGIIGLIMAKDYPVKVKKLIASGANVLQDTTAYFPHELELFKKFVGDPKYSNAEKKRYNLMIKYPSIPFEQLGKIKCPTMVVAGDKDEIRIGHTVKIFESISNAQLFIVPGTSHYVLSENAKVFNEAALKFLSK